MGSGTRLVLLVAVLAAVSLLPVPVSAVSLKHRLEQRQALRQWLQHRVGAGARVGVTVRGDDDEEDAVVQKSPVPPAMPVEMKILTDESEFPPNQPGAPAVPGFAAPPGEKPAPLLKSHRFAQLHHRAGHRHRFGEDGDEEGEDGSGGSGGSGGEGEGEEEGPAAVKTGAKKKEKKGDGEDDDETDEEKELKQALTNGTVVSRKEFPQSRPLPQRGTLKPPLASPPRWLFSMVKIGSKLYIFGGVASYSHVFWNDLWEYDFGMKEWRNEQASYIPPFPASNVVFQKPPENEFYRPNGIPAPPPLGISPMANADEDPINRPAGGAAELSGEPKALDPEVAAPDAASIKMASGSGMPSAAELRKMQEDNLRKQKLAAQQRREKMSPEARRKAQRLRMLRRKRLAARQQKQAEAAKQKQLKAMESKWRMHWQNKFEAEKKEWEKTHKHSVTIDMKGDESSPVSVAISKQQKVTPATDEEAKKEKDSEAEAAAGSDGSGGSAAEASEADSKSESEAESKSEAAEESDGSAEDEARFALRNSARFVQVNPHTGAEQYLRHMQPHPHHRSHSRSTGYHSHEFLPVSASGLFREPITSASSAPAPHHQWMGEFDDPMSLLQIDEEIADAQRQYAEAGNRLMVGLLAQRRQALYASRRQTPRYSDAESDAALLELSQGISSQTDFGLGDANANANANAGGFNAGFSAGSGASAGTGLRAGQASTVKEDEEEGEDDGSGLDPDADHAVVQDQQNPKFGTPFVGDEVWVFDIDTKKWKFVKKAIRLGAAFPQARWLHSAVVIDGKMVVFGGVNPDSVILGDVWMFNPDSASWLQAKVEGVPILPREGHSAIAVGNSMIVFGGISYAYSPFNDVWTYMSTENKWVMNKIEGVKPAPRWMHTAVLHAAKSGARSMFVFGGITHQYVPLNDLWRLSLSSMAWDQPATKGHAPFPRMLHAALIYEDTMFVHGGAANNMMHEDLWRIDLADDLTWEEQIPSGASPFARMGHQIQLVAPPMNPTPYRDNRPPWTPPDNSVPAPKTPKPFPLRPRKEYSTNRFAYLFGGARNSPSAPTAGFVARGPGTHAMPGPNAPGNGFGFPTFIR